MDKLIDAISKVKDKMQKFGDQLHQNEMLTRYVLIDPILRALGWDTENPEHVIPEISTPQGRPDYGLYYNGTPLVMVEAKPLGTDLNKVRDIGFQYCWQNKVPYFVLTDGNVWELYDMKELGGNNIFRIQISEDTLGDSARKLLALWRPAMPNVSEKFPELVISTIQQPPKPETSKISLKDLNQQNVTYTKISAKIHFPDGKTAFTETWQGLAFEVAKWALPKLKELGKLPLGRLIRDTKTKMEKPKSLDKDWFLETFLSAKDSVRESVRILKNAGIDPATVFIEGRIIKKM